MNTLVGHAEEACLSDAEYVCYWGNIGDVLMRLGGADYGDVMEEIKNQKTDPVTEEYYKELLKQWKKNDDRIKDKMNELDSAMELASGDEGEF